MEAKFVYVEVYSNLYQQTMGETLLIMGRCCPSGWMAYVGLVGLRSRLISLTTKEVSNAFVFGPALLIPCHEFTVEIGQCMDGNRIYTQTLSLLRQNNQQPHHDCIDTTPTAPYTPAYQTYPWNSPVSISSLPPNQSTLNTLVYQTLNSTA